MKTFFAVLLTTLFLVMNFHLAAWSQGWLYEPPLWLIVTSMNGWALTSGGLMWWTGRFGNDTN
jgi:hypothetical protein